MRGSIRSKTVSLIRRIVGTQGLRRPSPVYLGDHVSLTTVEWGEVLLVDTRDMTLSPALLLHGNWEPETTRWFREHVKPGMVFVDVGANIGYFSLLARRAVGDEGRVVAVEPHPRLVKLLRRNMIINGYRNVTVWQRAAWSGPDKLDFHIRTNYGANSSLGSVGDEQLDAHGDDEEVVKVEAVRLDDLLDELPRVDIMKIDVEGAEPRAFSGLTRTLERNGQIEIMFEWSPGQSHMLGLNPRDTLDLLVDHGFRFRLLDSNEDVEADELMQVFYANVIASR